MDIEIDAGPVQLVEVESLNYCEQKWYELRLGKLVLVHIRNWRDEGEPPRWDLYWPGRDSYQFDDTPTFDDPVKASRWFFLHCVSEHT